MTTPSVKIVYVLCTNNLDYLHLLPATTILTRTTLPACATLCIVNRQTRDFGCYLKTTMRTHVAGDFLYLDIDAIVVEDHLLALLAAPCIAASQNIDRPDISARFSEDIGHSIYAPLGWDHPFLPYVNAGVLFCRDNDKCHGEKREHGEQWVVNVASARQEGAVVYREMCKHTFTGRAHPSESHDQMTGRRNCLFTARHISKFAISLDFRSSNSTIWTFSRFNSRLMRPNSAFACRSFR